MPRTSKPSIRCNNAILQRGTIVRATRAKRMHLSLIFNDQDLSILDTLDLAFALLESRDLSEGGEVLQFVFLSHCSERAVVEMGAG